MLTTAQRDQAAVIDIGDTISVNKSFPSGATTTSLTQFLAVEGIEHTIDFQTGHRITFYTSPTTVLNPLILNDAIYGTLDSTNALASTAPPPPPVTVEYDMIYFQASSQNPTDATTRYVSNYPLSQVSTYSSAAITMSFTGTITSASINWIASSVVGTAETISAYIRLNDTTDYLIASVANTNTVRVFTNTAMSVPIVANDTIALKFVYPTWVTNPTSVSVGGYAIATIA